MQAALTITYQPTAGTTLTDPYWIRIEQVLPAPDRATVGQAAALLDRAFGLEVCEDGGEGAELVDLNEPALDEEQFRAATAEVIDLSYCEDGWDGSLDMHLKIIRSHPDLDYTLRLIGCEQTGPAVPTSGTAGLIATTADTITLEWPVVGDLQCEPAPVDRVGNTIRFAPDDQDATLRASWATVYDLVPIRVPAAAFEDDRDLRALAFMHGMVADLELTPEAPEPPDWSICPRDTWEALPSNDQVTCYEIVSHRFLCSCSGRPALRAFNVEYGGVVIQRTESIDFETEEIVPCPGEFHCVNNETECMHLLGSRTVTEYVECAEDNTPANAGGVVWQTSDPNFYLERCCTWPDVALPDCPYKTRTWRGGAQINNGEQHYRDLYGPATRFVPLSPPGGICGEWTIEQRLMSNNCCDGVEPLAWDEERSAEVAPINGVVDVYVTGGGRFPYNWTVDGEGFWLDAAHTKKRITTYTGAVRIYTQDSCGAADIWVEDGCSSIKGTVRSTNGRWVFRDDFIPHCIADPAANGFFECAAYGYPKDSGYTSFVKGRWWVGPQRASAPDIEPIWAVRDSSICGQWATNGCAGDLLVRAPGTPPEDQVLAPALVGGVMARCSIPGVGPCNPGVGCCLYWQVKTLVIMEWVC